MSFGIGLRGVTGLAAATLLFLMTGQAHGQCGGGRQQNSMRSLGTRSLSTTASMNALLRSSALQQAQLSALQQQYVLQAQLNSLQQQYALQAQLSALQTQTLLYGLSQQKLSQAELALQQYALLQQQNGRLTPAQLSLLASQQQVSDSAAIPGGRVR